MVKELRALSPGMIPVMAMIVSWTAWWSSRHVREGTVSAVLGDGADQDVYYAT